MIDHRDQIRIVQETVAGKEITLIASDIAIKSGNVYLGFADRFTGTLIITGDISDVRSALNEVVRYYHDVLGYVTCPVTQR